MKHQADVDAEFHDEEDKAAEIKNQVQHSNVEQPKQLRRWPRDKKCAVASGKKTYRTIVA